MAVVIFLAGLLYVTALKQYRDNKVILDFTNEIFLGGRERSVLVQRTEIIFSREIGQVIGMLALFLLGVVTVHP